MWVENNGKVVHVKPHFNAHQSVRAKIALNRGIFEWDVIIEKACNYSWVGMCASENFDYKTWAGAQNTGWVLGSCGYCCRNIRYCPGFGDGAKITVHLDMNKRTCA